MSGWIKCPLCQVSRFQDLRYQDQKHEFTIAQRQGARYWTAQDLEEVTTEEEEIKEEKRKEIKDNSN